MKSVKRLSRYTSILLSLLLMLSAVSPGLTALAQEKANAAPTALTYEDDSITAELKAAGGTSLPAGAALTVKALSKDSQDETEKALYAQTEAGLNAKASEQGTTIAGFTAYSITLTDQNKKDVTPGTGSFTLKVTDKNAAAPEAYKQSTDEQKSVALYQAAEAKDEQNNPVSTMEPKQEDAASINTDPDGNITGVETALTTLKPVAVTWQNPQQPQPQTAANEALSVQSSPELADNQFNYNFDVNGDTQNFQNFSIYFLKSQNTNDTLDISELLENRIAAKSVSLNTPITMEELMPDGLNYRFNTARLINSDTGSDNYGVQYTIKTVQLVKINNGYFYTYYTSGGQAVNISVNDTSWTLYFTCDEDFEKVKTIDSVSKGVTVQMFDYDKATPPIEWGNNDKGKITQNLLKRNLNDDLIPDREDNQGALTKSFSTENNSNYKGEANNLFRADKYEESNTFYYSSFENYAYWNGADKNDKNKTYPFTVYNALGTPENSSDSINQFYFWRGNFMPYNRISLKEKAQSNVNLYDPDGNILKDEDKPGNRKDEPLYKTQPVSYNVYNDYWFGMVVTADFSQLKDGMIKDKTGKSNPMVYDFNGDDDMWVFIDGVLVLDLGGIHDAHSGSINFATGEVKWTDWKTGKQDPGKETVTTKKTIREQFKEAGSEDKAEWSKNGEGNTFADYTGHEIKIFYMERGAGASNCKMQFNLPTVPKDSVSITKEVTNVNEGAYTDVDFDFKLYVQDDTAQEGDANTITDTDGKIYRLKTDQPYDLKEGTEIIKADQKTNENTGIFTLKHGQTAYFEELATQGTKYIVQEVGVNQNQYDEIKVNGEAVNENGDNITGEGDNRIIQTNPLTVGTNMIVKMQNKCDGENLHTINITKQIDGGQTSSDIFTAQVTIGGKPYTGAYKIADRNTTEEGWESLEQETGNDKGEIKLKANQTIRIADIAAGTSFEVTETNYNKSTYKDPSYAIAENTATDISTATDKASGKVQFGSHPKITITNHKNFSENNLEISKTAKVKDWTNRTYTITLTAYSTAGEVTDATIKDTIDPRFEVVDKNGTILNNGDGVDGGTLQFENNQVCFLWNDQKLGTEANSWTKVINLKAKADYVGGNNVPTNVAGNASSVTANGITKNFDQPKVNVRDILTVSNVTNTVFYADNVSAGNITAVETAMNKNTRLKDMVDGQYISIQDKLITVWYSDDTLSSPVTDLRGDLENKLKSQNSETPETYYQQITYPMAPSTPESAGNTSDNIAGTATTKASCTATAVNDGKATVNGTQAESASDSGKGYGVYTNNIVKGQLEITKTIDKPYTNIKQINANQTFVFKIERYEVEQNGSKGKLAETFYETINFDANDTNTNAKTKSKLISGLKKGYYTVTEETNWSQKYDLTETTDNYDKNNKAAVDLLIGDRLKEATQDNSKPEFYGLDETKLKNNSGEELPADQQYRNFAEGSKATVEFTNKLNTNWKWLSDTAAAVNVFDKKAE